MNNAWSAEQWTNARLPEDSLRNAVEAAGGRLLGVYQSGVPIVAGMSYEKVCEVAGGLASPKNEYPPEEPEPKKRKRGRPRKEA